MAGPSIGDVLLRVLGEWEGFEAEAKKKGAAAGQKGAESFNKSFGSLLKANAGKVLFAGASAGLAIATKGVLELQEVTAAYRAETGATAAEAERAGKAINDMAGRNIQPMEEVGRALTKVRTDMGLAGDEGEKLTEKFLKFGRATRMDAAAAVESFDNVLDNWGLTADKSGEIMDKLIVSHQKYGGNIEMNIDTLGKLAPAMRAANMDIDDAIALLGLFGSKGLDADQATAAFAKSLTKVKSPEELQKLIADIAATEDPFERASKAADLFGARAGAKLANALGGAHLDDYKISMNEATGATEKAAEVLDSTFGAQAKLRIKQFGAALIGLGSDFGPVLTGTAALASLGGSLGGGKLLGALGGPAKKLGVGLAKKIALGLAGNAAVAFLADGLVSGVEKAAKSPKLGKVGEFLGTKLGKGISIGLAAVAVVEVVETYNSIQREQASQINDIGMAIGEQIAHGTAEGLLGSRAALVDAINRLPAPVFGVDVAATARAGMMEQIRLINEALSQQALETQRKGEQMSEGLAAGITAGGGAVKDAMSQITAGPTSMARRDGAFLGRTFIQSFYRGVTEKQSIVQQALAAATQASETTMDKATETAYILGTLTSKEVARGARDKRDNVRAAYQETIRVAIERLERLAPGAENLSKKAWDALNKATKSKIPEVAAAAQKIVDRIEGKLDKTKTKPAGRKAAQDYADGVRSGKGAVGQAAEALAKSLLFGLIAKLKAAGGGSIPVSGHQTGGEERAGVPRIVGERRAEIFVPEVAGHTYASVAEGLEAMGVGGGTNVNINLEGLAPVRSPRDIVIEMIRVQNARLLPPSRVSPMYRRPAGA